MYCYDDATIPDPQLDGPDATATASSTDEVTDASTTWRKNGRRKPTSAARVKKTAPPYKVICISTYTADLEQLDSHVAELKRRGKTNMSRSQLIRLAIANLDLDKVG